MNTKQVRVVTVRKRRYSLAAIILLTAVGIGSLYLAYQGGLYQSGRIADRTPY